MNFSYNTGHTLWVSLETQQQTASYIDETKLKMIEHCERDISNVKLLHIKTTNRVSLSKAHLWMKTSQIFKSIMKMYEEMRSSSTERDLCVLEYHKRSYHRVSTLLCDGRYA
ncbi:hypothetical protein EGW08_003127, partial [Elysia chlorotica]